MVVRECQRHFRTSDAATALVENGGDSWWLGLSAPVGMAATAINAELAQ